MGRKISESMWSFFYVIESKHWNSLVHYDGLKVN